MFESKKRKKQRQFIEGLKLLEDAMEVQLEQARWWLGHNDLTEEQKIRWGTYQSHCKYVLKEIKDIWDGKKTLLKGVKLW